MIDWYFEIWILRRCSYLFLSFYFSPHLFKQVWNWKMNFSKFHNNCWWKNGIAVFFNVFNVFLVLSMWRSLSIILRFGSISSQYSLNILTISSSEITKMFYFPIKRDGYPSDFTDLYFKWFLHKIFTKKKYCCQHSLSAFGIMQKLCLSTKFSHQKIRWNYCILCSDLRRN